MCKLLSLIFVPLIQHWSREVDSTRHWIFFDGWQRTQSLRAGPVTMSWITWPYNAIHRFSDASYYKWLLAKSCLDAANKIAEGRHIANTHNIYQWFLSMKNDENIFWNIKGSYMPCIVDGFFHEFVMVFGWKDCCVWCFICRHAWMFVWQNLHEMNALSWTRN